MTTSEAHVHRMIDLRYRAEEIHDKRDQDHDTRKRDTARRAQRQQRIREQLAAGNDPRAGSRIIAQRIA